ncbi:MAG: DUF4339 domain-containing protein [Pirellulaceae bacterium]|nr:DUF4339 domain-containing protein [Pirellulaceae bacterium]
MQREWYYKKQGRKLGPFTDAQLKALVDHGKLQPYDSVWKEGMKDWVPADRISGLFPGDVSTAATSVETPRPPENTATFVPEIPVVEQRAKPFESVTVSATRSADVSAKTPIRHSKLSRNVEPADEPLLDLAVPAIIVDLYASLAKGLLRIRNIRRSVSNCLNIGHVFLMLTVTLGIFVAILASLKLESGRPLTVHLGMFAIALLGQWVARNFSFVALEALKSNPSVVRSYRLLDTLGALGSVVALAAFAYSLTLIINNATDENPNTLVILIQLLVSILIFFGLLLAAAIFYSADALNVRVEDTATAGQEFLGLGSFVLKVALYMSPFLYTGLAIFACFLAGVATYRITTADEADSTVTAVIVLESLFDIESNLVIGCLAPLLFYLVFLVLYLFIDLCYSILSIRSLKLPTDNE